MNYFKFFVPPTEVPPQTVDITLQDSVPLTEEAVSAPPQTEEGARIPPTPFGPPVPTPPLRDVLVKKTFSISFSRAGVVSSDLPPCLKFSVQRFRVKLSSVTTLVLENHSTCKAWKARISAYIGRGGILLGRLPVEFSKVSDDIYITSFSFPRGSFFTATLTGA